MPRSSTKDRPNSSSLLTRGMKALLGNESVHVNTDESSDSAMRDQIRKQSLNQVSAIDKSSENTASLLGQDIPITSPVKEHDPVPSTQKLSLIAPLKHDQCSATSNTDSESEKNTTFHDLNVEFLYDSLSDFDLDVRSPCLGARPSLDNPHLDNNATNPISSPDFHSTQIPVSLDARISKIVDEKISNFLSLQESCSANVALLKDKIVSSEANSSLSLENLSRRIESMESKLEHENLEHFSASVSRLIDKVAASEVSSSRAIAKLSHRIELIENKPENVNPFLSDELFEQKVKSIYDHIENQIKEAKNEWFSSQPTPPDLESTVTGLLNSCLEKKQVDLGASSTLVIMMQEVARALFDNSLSEFKNDLESLKEKQAQIANLIKEVQESINFSSDPNVQEVPYNTKSTDLKLEKLVSWADRMQTQLNYNTANIESLDVNRRKSNLIMEGFEELPQEDLKERVLQFLTHFVPFFHPSWLSITYRLGKFSDSFYPRKVLLSFISLEAKEHVLSQAGVIARAGFPGKRIFINEDISEETKRKRADIRKYAAFLGEKGIPATQKGDGIVINDCFHTLEDLKHMPNGLSLKDSRTHIKGKYWAFQSVYSPLSNLYPCRIKRNGIQYASAEHAYQHAKAVENRDYIRARAILAQPSSHEALSIAKGIKTDSLWLENRQLLVMEEILRLKKEQCPEFASELADSANHILVEYTRSHFWGSGSTTDLDHIATGAYRGLNHLGRLLAKIRDNF